MSNFVKVGDRVTVGKPMFKGWWLTVTKVENGLADLKYGSEGGFAGRFNVSMLKKEK